MHVECAFLDSEVVAIVLRPAPRKGCMRSGEGGLLCFPKWFNAFACICEQQQLCRQPVPKAMSFVTFVINQSDLGNDLARVPDSY